MKNLAVVLAVLVSSFGFGQDDFGQKLKAWSDTTKTYKSVGVENEQQLCIGILENVLSDPLLVKKLYNDINPDILGLRPVMNGPEGDAPLFGVILDKVATIDTTINYKIRYSTSVYELMGGRVKEGFDVWSDTECILSIRITYDNGIVSRISAGGSAVDHYVVH
jgi:hypothetical protein